MVATPCGFKSRSRHSLAGAETVIPGFPGMAVFSFCVMGDCVPCGAKASGGRHTPRKRNWLLAQPRFGGYAFHTKEDCCRRGDQYRPCPGCLVFLISLIERSTRISVHISSFNTAFLTPFSHLPHFYLQKYPKPRIINFMFCFVTKIKCETEVKIRRCWEWDAGFGWTQRKRKGNAYE